MPESSGFGGRAASSPGSQLSGTPVPKPTRTGDPHHVLMGPWADPSRVPGTSRPPALTPPPVRLPLLDREVRSRLRLRSWCSLRCGGGRQPRAGPPGVSATPPEPAASARCREGGRGGARPPGFTVVALAERHRDRDVEIGEPAAGDLLGLLVELCEQRRGQGPDGGKRIGLVAVTTELRHDRVGFDPCRVEVCRLELPSRVAQRGSQPMVAACTTDGPGPSPSAPTCAAVSGWSNLWETTTWERPALIAATVVPTPAWWSAARHRA
jgi:hypothetical protein